MSEETKKENKVNVLDGILREAEMHMTHNLLMFSVGAGYASVVVEKLKSRFPDAKFVVYGEVNSIIYRDVDSQKVVDELNRRKDNLKKQIDEYTLAIAKVTIKK